MAFDWSEVPADTYCNWNIDQLWLTMEELKSALLSSAAVTNNYLYQLRLIASRDWSHLLEGLIKEILSVATKVAQVKGADASFQWIYLLSTCTLKFEISSKRLEQECVQSFISRNCSPPKEVPRGFGAFIRKWASEEISSFLDAYKQIEKYPYHSSGATAQKTHGQYERECNNSLDDRISYTFPGSWSFHKYGNYKWYNLRTSEFYAVMKSWKAYRGIAAEPIQLGFWQHAIQCALEDAIEASKLGGYISIHNQGVSRFMAVYGAVTGDFATIDLSNASDDISRSLIDELFPSWFVRELLSVRSTMIKFPNGVVMKNNIFTTMGSGVTFPLESIIFALISIAACRYTASVGQDGLAGLTVYGDDIVIPTQAYTFACMLLEEAGFSVNLDKSYATGYFREACGVHVYKSTNISPLYFKRGLRSRRRELTYDAILRLEASVKKFLPRLEEMGYWPCIEFLSQYVSQYHIRLREGNKRYRTYRVAECSPLGNTWLNLSGKYPARRYNRMWQEWEYKYFRPTSRTFHPHGDLGYHIWLREANRRVGLSESELRITHQKSTGPFRWKWLPDF
jgi:hypothetical protein